MEDIYEVKEIFDSIYNVIGRLAKEKILIDNKDNKLFLDCLKFLIDPHIRTGISTAKLNKKLNHLEFHKLHNITEVMDYLKINNTGKDMDIMSIQVFILNQDKELYEFLKLFVTKKLRLGLNDKIINKIIPGLIAASDDNENIKPMLASKFDFNNLPQEKMFISEKLDGIRCNVVIRNSKVKLYSRQGKIIEGLEQIENDLSNIFANAFIDGELIAEGCSYENVYKETIKRVKNKNIVKTGVKYVMFDILSLKEYDDKICNTNYECRRRQLNNYIDDIKENDCKHIEVLPVIYEGENINEVLSLLDKYRKLGAEGLMCNLNKAYEFKRTKSILKIKVMQSCDLKIIGFERGEGKYSNTLGNIICDYKGYKLGVGSGFTDAMRNEIYNNQEKYLNRIVEVSYFEETHNENGELSLRFPIFKCIREEEKEVSYE